MSQRLFPTIHNAPCKIIEEQTLWGQTICRIWLPDTDTVARVPQKSLKALSVDRQPEIDVDRIVYVAAAAKVAEALEGRTSGEGQVLLAPMESKVIPLPHQIHALSRVISGDRVRYLLADEVGLGKTIEAGLVIRELKLRGLVRRTLIIAPKGLTTQWVAEMQTHFSETFKLVLPGDLKTLNRAKPRWFRFVGKNAIINKSCCMRPLPTMSGKVTIWPCRKTATFWFSDDPYAKACSF